MDLISPDLGMFFWNIFIVSIIPTILFLLTQQNTLKAIRRDNRSLRPGLVWLQLIPIFNFYWMFVVVIRIADSIYKEHSSSMDDSMLGVADPDGGSFGKRPTYGIGITWCVLYLLLMLVSIFFNLFYSGAGEVRNFAIFLLTLCLSIITCWIIYWVQLAGEKRKLPYLQA